MDAENGKLSLLESVAYGGGQITVFLPNSMISVFWNPFLLLVAGISPYTAGLLLILMNVMDAVANPIIGYISDFTVSKYGRRRQWLLYSIVPQALTYMALWQVPSFLTRGSGSLVLYFVIFTLLNTILADAYAVPYSALTPDLTRDYDERTKLTSWRMVFAIISGMIGLLFQGVLIDRLGLQHGFAWSGILIGVLIIAPAFITFYFTRERYVLKSSDSINSEMTQNNSLCDSGIIAQKVKTYFRNMYSAMQLIPFTLLTMMFLFCWLSVNLLTNNFYLYFQYVLEKPQHFLPGILVAEGVSFLCIPFWSAFSSKYGKKTTYYTACALGVPVNMLTFLVTHTTPVVWTYLLNFLGGVSLSVFFLIPWSMLPDVIELDELQTGQRREGTFYSLFVFFEKFGVAIGLAISNFVLGWSGFKEADGSEAPGEGSVVKQSEETVMMLRIMTTIVPGIITAVSVIFVYFYPITKEKHEDIKRMVIEKRRELEMEGEGDSDVQLENNNNFS